MKDPQIRHLLKSTELKSYIDCADTVVVDELVLPVAKARVDIAVINGHLHGYEIKSASDTLKRLPDQLKSYELVFDYLTVVTEKKYYQKICALIPEWVGISICSYENGKANLVEEKAPSQNPHKKGFYIAKLLCKEELMMVLSEHRIQYRKSDRAWTMCEILERNLDINTLSDSVRKTLKRRKY